MCPAFMRHVQEGGGGHPAAQRGLRRAGAFFSAPPAAGSGCFNQRADADIPMMDGSIDFTCDIYTFLSSVPPATPPAGKTRNGFTMGGRHWAVLLLAAVGVAGMSLTRL